MLRVHDKDTDLKSVIAELKKLGLPTEGLFEADIYSSRLPGTDEGLPSIRLTYRFENGCGYSLVRNRYSYGQEKGRFELAIITEREKWTIDYETPLLVDVEGWLTESEVNKLHEEIKNFNWLLS